MPVNSINNFSSNSINPYLVLDTTSFLKQQKIDPFSGDFTQIGNKLYSGKIDRVDLSDAVRINTKISIYSNGSPSYDAMLNLLRENGLSSKIDWKRTEMDFSLAGEFSITDAQASFSTIVDYIASKHVALKQQIFRDFSGENYETQLKILNQMSETAVDHFAKTFSESVGAFYEDNGLLGEKKKMAASVKSAVQSRIDQYQSFVGTHENYVRLEDSRDQWLFRCSDYVASELRDAAQETLSASVNMDDGSLYNSVQLEESYKLAYMAVHLQNSFLGGTTEEEKGLRQGILLLETEMISQSSNATDAMKDVFKNSISAFIGVPYSENSNSVQKTITDMILNEYRNTKDIHKAVDAGIKLGYDHVIAKGNGKSDFWKYMYDQKSPSGNDYLNHLSTQEKIFQSLDSMLNKADLNLGLFEMKFDRLV